MKEQPKLDSRPRRQDLTDREMASILGGLIGSLCQNADIDDVRRTVRWWAEHDEPWQMMKNGVVTIL